MRRVDPIGFIDPIAVNRLRMVTNDLAVSRQELMNKLTDPRRDLAAECGYPIGAITADMYRQLYDRNPIAARVVELMPKESWQVQPMLYEDEDVENVTPFEASWVTMCQSLRGQSWFKDEEGNPLWEYLLRADILSGIGCYGIILLGIDDGKELSEPVEGINPDGTVSDIKPLDPAQVLKDAQAKAQEQNQPRGEAVGDEPMPDDGEDTGGSVGPEPFDDEEDGYTRTDPTAKKKPLVGNAFPPPKKAGEKKPLDDDPEADPLDEETADFDYDTEEDPNALNDPHDPNSAFGTQSMDGQGSDDGMGFGETDGPQVAGPVKMERKLLFVRCFDQSQCQITSYEKDPTNPRFGQPTMYLITFNDLSMASQGGGSIGLPLTSKNVHWTRVVHIVDNRGANECFGIPRQQQVFNNLLDLQKVYGASAEGYYKSCFTGLSFETHPQLGGDVIVDKADVKNQIENYSNGLQRYLALMGMSVNPIAPEVVDPTPILTVHLDAICVKLTCPKRIFVGSERGELASGQDDGQWNDRLRQRQADHNTPRIIVPVVDRLIMMKVLPAPETGFCVVWPDLDSQDEATKATIGLQKTQAIAAYVSGQCEELVPKREYFVHIMGMDEKVADEICQASDEQLPDEMSTVDPAMDQEMHDATVEQMNNPDMVPDPPVMTGDHHHYPEGYEGSPGPTDPTSGDPTAEGSPNSMAGKKPKPSFGKKP